MRAIFFGLGFMATTAFATSPAPAAEVEQLQGLWQFTFSGWNGSYSGDVTIGPGSKATSNVKGPTRTTKQTGTITTEGSTIRIVFTAATNGYNPDRYTCRIETAASLRCTGSDTGDTTIEGFTMRRPSTVAVPPQDGRR